jgi:hypothetical protein
MDNIIICPNCGAENKNTENCEFCGTVLSNSISGTLLSNSKGTKKLYEQTPDKLVEIVGEYTLKIDERIFERSYDKFKDKTKIRLQFEIFKFLRDRNLNIQVEYTKYSSANKGHLYISGIESIIIGDKRLCASSTYIDFSNLHTLETVCEASEISVKMYGSTSASPSDEQAKGLIFIARICYNTFYDNSKYTDAVDLLYEYFKKVKGKIDPEEIWRKRVKEIRLKEEKLREEKLRKKKKEQSQWIWAFCIWCLFASLMAWLICS